MTAVHVWNADLNLLKALEILLDERHVSRAAARMHVTQSAMSRTLGRLRSTFGDELLVRTASGYELTPRARSLEEELSVLLPKLRSVLRGNEFDPMTSTDAVRIAATDYGLTVMGEFLFPEFVRQAPHMSFVVEPLTPTTFEDLERGRVDLALTPVVPPSPLKRQTLFEEDYVCLLSKDHPAAAGDRITLDMIIAYPHVRVVAMDVRQMLVESWLDRLGALPTAAVTVPYFSVLPHALPGTNLIALLPRRFARRYGGGSLHVAEGPAEFSAFAYPMVWHPRLSADPAHRWVRGLFLRAGAAV